MNTNSTAVAESATPSPSYDFDGLAAYLNGYYTPLEVSQRLQLVYCTLAECLVRDADCAYDRIAVADAMGTLREVREAIESMNNLRP